MTGVYGIMRAAILADSIIATPISSRVYSMLAPGNQKPPYIVIAHSGNTPTQTAGSEMLEHPHIALNVYIDGLNQATLKTIVDELVILFKLYNEQSGGRSYTIVRLFDQERLDQDGQLMWSFEYLVVITDD